MKEKHKQTKKTKTERNERDKTYSERVRAKWFCRAFKLEFIQLICKASLIFKSNLEQANFKRKRIIRVKACCGGMKMFKNMKLPDDLKSFLVYQFTCASGSSSYVGETGRYFKTRLEGYIKKDNKSDIFKHLYSAATFFDSYNSISFKIINKANFKLYLKNKEALHMNWRKPNLKAQQNHLALTLSLYVLSPLFFSVFVLFLFACVSLLSIIFIISNTHYRHLLLS